MVKKDKTKKQNSPLVRRRDGHSGTATPDEEEPTNANQFDDVFSLQQLVDECKSLGPDYKFGSGDEEEEEEQTGI